MAQTDDKLLTPHQPQQSHTIAVPSQANTIISRWRPNLPPRYLFMAGRRENYLRFGVPLYEASVRCNWNDAKVILDRKPELIRYSITRNGDTALHVAASSKCDPKAVVEFVKNLVGMMREKDLALENENFNTAFYLAAVAGNVEAVKIMAEKNKILPTIPGGDDQYMLPLYAAAVFENYEVVKYLYEESRDLGDDSWNPHNRGRLLEKCVENDMFDVALKIVKRYPELRRSGISLGVLARKPEAFRVTKSNIVWNTINSAFVFTGLKVKTQSDALTFLRFIWEHISEMSKRDIDFILRGPVDLIEEDDKTISGWAIQAMQFQNLISMHVAKMKEETRNIITRPRDATNPTTKISSVDEEHALELHNLISERLVNMNAETQKIIKGPRDLLKQDNKPISSRGDIVLKLQNLIFKHIANMHERAYNIMTSKMTDKASNLHQVIWKQIERMEMETRKVITRPRSAKATHSSRVLFVAAETGNTKFLIELIYRYPDLIWNVNDDNLSIFHIAVKHRHEGIYSLLYEIGSMKDLITPLKDINDNNMLHLVGKVPIKKGLMSLSGAALQMQRELLWFMDVRNMIPPSYRNRVNKDGRTPTQLFLEEHKELIKEGEKWLKDTASQCMVAAALIATIAFAAIFTIPGGYNQDNGIPILYRKPTFGAFVVADAMSLFLSSTSILALLSIFTSRYAEFDFMESLPKKLMSGMLSLYLSIITMMITFSISLFILCHKEMIWIPILFCVLALMPVILYSMSQYHMFLDVIRSTYGSKHFFKPKKQSLNYVKPSV